MHALLQVFHVELARGCIDTPIHPWLSFSPLNRCLLNAYFVFLPFFADSIPWKILHFVCAHVCLKNFCAPIARTGAPEGGSVGVSVGGAGGGANYPSGGASSGGSYDLDDFEDGSAVQEQQDYAYLVRSRLASEHKQKSNVAGFEVSYSV